MENLTLDLKKYKKNLNLNFFIQKKKMEKFIYKSLKQF